MKIKNQKRERNNTASEVKHQYLRCIIVTSTYSLNNSLSSPGKHDIRSMFQSLKMKRVHEERSLVMMVAEIGNRTTGKILLIKCLKCYGFVMILTPYTLFLMLSLTSRLYIKSRHD